MKRIYLLSAIVLGGFLSNKAQAQISIHVGFNIPARHVYVPAPAPVEPVYNDDFDDSDDYYYLPEVEAYYSIPLARYFYFDSGRWVSAAYLPGAYRNYDWRTARRFEIRGRRPYMHHDVYRGRWGGNENRGNWGRRDNDYASRGYDNNRYNRGGGYNQPNRNDRNGYDRQNQYGGGRGNWGSGQQQPDRNNGSGPGNWGGGQQQQPSQPDRNNGGGRGNWGGGQQQQPAQPDRNNGSGRGNWGGGQQQQPSQPTQNGGGRDRNYGGGQVAQNTGGANPRQSGMRPPRF